MMIARRVINKYHLKSESLEVQKQGAEIEHSALDL